MKRSEAINELAAALAKAQPAFEAAGRDHKAKVETKTGGYYEFNYADFAAYLDVCRKPLGEQGLSFTQEAVTDNQLVSVTTLLMHTSGQWIETAPLTLPLIPDSRGAVTAQIIGSGITYAKRYSLSSLIGLASEADDDGNQASGNQAETGKREPNPACPNCGKSEHVIKGKAEFGGGWVCWKSKGGCGEKWQDATPADKAKADAIAAEHGMQTGDQIEKPASSLQAGLDQLAGYTKVLALVTFADWVKAERIAKRLNAQEYADLDSKIAEKAVALPSNEKGFEAAEKLLRSLHHEMRISEGDYLQFCTKLADAKDAKLGAAA